MKFISSAEAEEEDGSDRRLRNRPHSSAAAAAPLRDFVRSLAGKDMYSNYTSFACW